jgi:ligand-binding sensor domain-containing protein/signal transduction histidine kinase
MGMVTQWVPGTIGGIVVSREAWLKIRIILIFWLLMAGLLVTACGKKIRTITPEPGVEPATSPNSESLSTGQANLYTQDLPLLGTLRFERLGLEEGLSQSVVICILQDSLGFMWFGTQDGLNRYDGYNFTVFSSNPYNSNSLSDRWISVIYEDQKGGLWIGTRQGGLNLYDRTTGTFTDYQSDPQNPNSLSDNTVTGIAEDNQGRIWVSTRNGLNLLEPDTGLIIRFLNDPNDQNSVVNNSINVLARDREGMIWVGTDIGLDRINPQTEQFTHYVTDQNDPYSLSSNIVKVLYEDQGGILWIGTANGLNWFERRNGQFIKYRYRPNDPASLSNNNIQSIHEDRSGALWVGTDHGLNRLDRETGAFTRYFQDSRDPYSISGNSIQSVYEDRAGVLWVGTFGGGLNRSYQGKWGFTHIQANPENQTGLNDKNIFPIYEDVTGDIWFGTYEGGLNRLNRRTGKFTYIQNESENPDSLSGDHIWAIYQDRGGTLWFGTSYGLDEFNTENYKFVHHRNDPLDPASLSGNEIYAIFEDSQGIFWVGTTNGLNRFDRQSGQSLRYFACSSDPGCLSGNQVTTLYEDRSGRLWVGTFDGGLNLLDRATGMFKAFKNEPHNIQSLSNNSVMAIYQDKRGDLWIATAGGGLNKFHNESETFTHYQELEGLPNDVVYGILEDNGGDLWLSTNKGISQFDPLTGSFKNYDVADGLQSNEFSMFSYFKTRSGEMFFGGVNGVTMFFPEQIMDNSYVPPIVLTSLTQAGEDAISRRGAETIQEVTFYWPRNFFEFEYAALSYAQPEKNQYAYMLEGFDKDWIMMGTRRFGRYTNLPGRTYTLRIKGSNNDGVWNDEGIAIKIRIVPPFWETIWFRGIAVLALFVVMVGGFRLRVKNIEARSRELEYQVKERTREIERRNQEMDALSLANERMHRYLALDQVLQTLVDVAVDMLKADKSAVFVWDEERNKLTLRVARGFSSEALTRMTGSVVEADPSDAGTNRKQEKELDSTPENTQRNNYPDILQAFRCEGVLSSMQLPIEIGGKAFGVFAVCSGRPNAFREDEQRLFAALIQRAALSIENAQLFEQTKELVVMEERSRLARDLHDSAKQKAFAALAQLGAASGIIKNNPTAAKKSLTEAENLVYEVIQELTFLIQELYPLALKEKGLVTALREYIFEWENRTDIQVDFKIDGAKKLPLDIEQALYRIVQESLANIARHSQAGKAGVSLSYNTYLVEVIISDNGQGFDVGQKPFGLGLHSMRERADMIGGSLRLESKPGEGTRVIIQVPFETMS